jgi:hypothetical protein
MMARDRAVASWLVQDVGPAHDALKADPSRALTIDLVRSRLDDLHKEITAKT